MKFERYLSPKWILLSGVVFLLSCGGSGGGRDGASASFSFSPDILNFVAETPAAAPQGSRLVTASIDRNLEGVLYLLTGIQGDVVTGFNNFGIDTGGLSASTLLNIATPFDLGTGVHTGRLTIRACLNSPNCSSGELSGSPQTVDVTYEVKSSVKADTMMPNTGIANRAGWVILRGPAIADVNAVTFGTSAAKSVVFVSDSEIHAEYDALLRGTYEVQLEDALGDVPFDADLKIVAASAFPAASLAYPAVIEQVLEVVFDVEREALLVAVELADRNDNQILRYQFAAGSFTSLTTLSLPLVRDLALSPDGNELIAITDSSIKHLDPVSLTESASTLVVQGTDFFLKNMAVSNDGNVFVVAEEIGSVPTAANYAYILSTRTFFSATLACGVNLRSTGSADGSSIIVINDGLRGAQDFCEYDASAGSFVDQGAFDTKVCRDCPSALSSRGVRYAYAYDISGSGIIVYDNDDSALLNELGRIAGTFSSIAFDQEGNTLYAYDSVNSLLRTYDLTTPLAGNTFQEIGSGTSLAGGTGEKVKMQVSQDDGTIFVAGETSIAVQPLP